MNPLSSSQNVPYHLSYQRCLDDNSLCTCTFWSIYHSLKFRNDQIDFFQILHRFRRTILYMTASVSWRLNILCIKFKIGAFFLTTLLIQSCVDWHFTHMWKTLAWLHHFTKRGCLTPPLFIEVPVPSQDNDMSCICVLEVTICLFQRLFDWILELFWRCGIFCFSFYEHK